MAKKEKRIVADCRKYPSKKHCTLTIAGKMTEILPIAIWHAVRDHGHKDSPKFRREMRGFIVKDNK